MSGIKIKLRSAGFAALARSDGARAVTSRVANSIAADLDGAEVDEYTTDRAVSAVGVPAYKQARNGALTRAAARNGISVS